MPNPTIKQYSPKYFSSLFSTILIINLQAIIPVKKAEIKPNTNKGERFKV